MSATLLSAQEHREQAAYLRQFPGPKAQRAAELAELVARLIEKRGRRTYAKQQIADPMKQRIEVVKNVSIWNSKGASDRASLELQRKIVGRAGAELERDRWDICPALSRLSRP